jgi:hypothetical protein
LEIWNAPKGNHKTKHSGSGDEHTGEFEFHFGDGLERISLTESLRNAQWSGRLHAHDLVVEDTQYKSDEYGTDDWH